MADIESADDLYSLEPSEFVAARDALAKRMRKEGRREDAAAVAKLRRPPATAWALNVTSSEHPELVVDALEAGQELRDATEAAVGGDASGLRSATASERAAADRLLSAASAHLGGGREGRERMSATLRAAAVDEAVADQLRRGVLAVDHEASGFGFTTGFEVGEAPSRPRSAPARAKKKRSAPDRAAEAAAEAERIAERERARAALEARVIELEAAAREAVAVADEAESEAAKAAERAESARSAADAAELELDAAQRALDET